MERGYIKLWRRTLDSGLLQNPTALQVFMYLLLKASHKPHRQLVGNQSVELESGEVVTGRIKIAADLSMSEKQVRTALGVLEKLEIVAIKRTNKYSIVSFVNWARYQQDVSCEGPTDEPTTGQQRASNGPQTRMKECKNINKNTSYSLSESDSDGCPPCPHGKILEVYREVLPELAQPRTWRTTDQNHLRARWREKWKEKGFDLEGGVKYFRDFFTHIQGSHWLMGRRTGRDGRAFKADIRWFIEPKHFDDIIAGKYHDH